MNDQNSNSSTAVALAGHIEMPEPLLLTSRQSCDAL